MNYDDIIAHCKIVARDVIERPGVETIDYFVDHMNRLLILGVKRRDATGQPRGHQVHIDMPAATADIDAAWETLLTSFEPEGVQAIRLMAKV